MESLVVVLLRIKKAIVVDLATLISIHQKMLQKHWHLLVQLSMEDKLELILVNLNKEEEETEASEEAEEEEAVSEEAEEEEADLEEAVEDSITKIELEKLDQFQDSKVKEKGFD